MLTNNNDDLKLVRNNDGDVFLRVIFDKSAITTDIAFDMLSGNLSDALTRGTSINNARGIFSGEVTIDIASLIETDEIVTCELHLTDFDNPPKKKADAEYFLTKLVSNINIVLFKLYGIEDVLEPEATWDIVE